MKRLLLPLLFVLVLLMPVESARAHNAVVNVLPVYH